jgi:hypothetical protein
VPVAPPPARIPTYTIENIGTLPGFEGNQGWYGSYARGLNDAGTVVGVSWYWFWDCLLWYGERAFVYADGVIEPLPTLGVASRAWAINEAGDIVGETYGGSPAGENATIWHASGAVEFIPPIDGQVGDPLANWARDINDFGAVVGNSTRPGGCGCGFSCPYLYWNGITYPLGIPWTGWGEEVASINNAFQIVGTYRVPGGNCQNAPVRAFLWQPWEWHDLLGPDGNPVLSAGDINNCGMIVGGGPGWVIWMNGVPSYAQVECLGHEINDHGDGVGGGGSSSSPAYLCQEGRRIYLPLLIPPSAEWTLWTATDINNRGQIAGYGNPPPGAPQDASGFLLTPINCDVNGSGRVDLQDYASLQGCLTGPGTPVGGECMINDLDHDGDVDFVDYRSIELAFEPN